jgi:hypothetical protein
MNAKSELLRRHAAVEAAVAKYRGKPLDYRNADCIRMARTVLVKLGHKPAKLPRYSNLLGARRALKAKGFDTIDSLLGSMLPRIAPSSALPGDLLVVEGDSGLDCIWIALGGGRGLGWHVDAQEAVIVSIEKVKAAYRV